MDGEAERTGTYLQRVLESLPSHFVHQKLNL